jgi:hypothetical protein
MKQKVSVGVIKERLKLLDCPEVISLLQDILSGSHQQNYAQIEELRARYKKYIYDNTPRDPRQGSIFG